MAQHFHRTFGIGLQFFMLKDLQRGRSVGV